MIDTTPTPQQSQERYVIAVKRSERQNAPADWVEKLQLIPGVTLLSPIEQGTPKLALISATAAGIAEVRRQLGQICHIEPEIFHSLASEILPQQPE